MKRTPLRRRVALQRGAPLRRVTAMRQRSARAAARQRARREVLAALLDERGPWCEARLPGCDGLAVDGHEPLTRGRGGDPADAAQIVLVCAICHRRIHDNPEEATARGLLISQWAQRQEQPHG
ncbi:MAG: hypothetical protein KY469_10615 [Actinobacteria bacterium]|nr:hypothetical protein [Actinomycetota bacterium]